jgi:anti-anti-sigma regulatory factor
VNPKKHRKHKRPLRKSCPKCGSQDVYNHDKGIKKLFRFFTMDSRLVCRTCNTTWRRLTPEKFSKLKHRFKFKPLKKEGKYHLKNADGLLSLTTNDEIIEVINQWEKADQKLVCLDMGAFDELTTSGLGNLMNAHRKIRAIQGDMILTNVSATLHENLWALNLGYLVATTQTIES